MGSFVLKAPVGQLPTATIGGVLTDISQHIGRHSVDISANTRPIVTDNIGRPSVGRHIDQHVDRDPDDMSADTRPTCDSRYVYRYSVESDGRH